MKFRANAPSLVLCDIGLPGMSGYEGARKVRGIAQSGVQLVAVAGALSPRTFDGHVAKPCDPTQIERLLK